MLKSIRYNDICQKFHRGINKINDDEIIDYAITSFGGFTDSFVNGVGRRIDLNQDDCELSINTVAEINQKTFHFVRCYTNYQFDTKQIDKKQDIVKYAVKLNQSIDDCKIVLPLIAYYSNNIDFSDNMYFNNFTDSRDIGYANCLIVKNKFAPTQDFFKFISFLTWQKDNARIKDVISNNYHIAISYINKTIKNIGYEGIVFDTTKDSLMVYKKSNFYKLSQIDKDERIYISIIFDIIMRCLILNPLKPNPFQVDGCIGITYKFRQKKLFNKLINCLCKQLPNVQFLI